MIVDGEEPQQAVIATGTEVSLAVAAAQSLKSKGVEVRVVSMPSLDVFESQPLQYQESVLQPELKARVVVEAGVTALWAKYAGPTGKILGVDSFGESAPGKDLYELFNLTSAAVEQAVLEQVNASA